MTDILVGLILLLLGILYGVLTQDESVEYTGMKKFSKEFKRWVLIISILYLSFAFFSGMANYEDFW